MSVLAFSDAGYVVAAYLSTAAVLGVYVARVLARGRALSKQVRPEDRRWT
ncbi:MAG: heme exporter protein CcmD [Acidimicrobiia bacterium]